MSLCAIVETYMARTHRRGGRSHYIIAAVVLERYLRFRYVGSSVKFNSSQIGSFADVRSAIVVNSRHLSTDRHGMFLFLFLLNSALFLMLADEGISR